MPLFICLFGEEMVGKGSTWYMIVSSAPEEAFGVGGLQHGPAAAEEAPCICAHEKICISVSHTWGTRIFHWALVISVLLKGGRAPFLGGELFHLLSIPKLFPWCQRLPWPLTSGRGQTVPSGLYCTSCSIQNAFLNMLCHNFGVVFFFPS